jgi:hypothetical protein
MQHVEVPQVVDVARGHEPALGVARGELQELLVAGAAGKGRRLQARATERTSLVRPARCQAVPRVEASRRR